MKTSAGLIQYGEFSSRNKIKVIDEKNNKKNIEEYKRWKKFNVLLLKKITLVGKVRPFNANVSIKLKILISKENLKNLTYYI